MQWFYDRLAGNGGVLAVMESGRLSVGFPQNTGILLSFDITSKIS